MIKRFCDWCGGQITTGRRVMIDVRSYDTPEMDAFTRKEHEVCRGCVTALHELIAMKQLEAGQHVVE
jgi:hypothetical protein